MLETILMLVVVLVALLTALTLVGIYNYVANYKHQNKVSDTKRPFFRYGWNTLKFWRKP